MRVHTKSIFSLNLTAIWFCFILCVSLALSQGSNQSRREPSSAKTPELTERGATAVEESPLKIFMEPVCALTGQGIELAMGRSKTKLTMKERIRYQRAIEEVYWRHRIWPKENPKPKPALDQIMPDAVLSTKVEDYLRKSEALRVYWQRPITEDQLQAEMERMTRQTKRSAILKELWAALNNDPYLIAECLARPLLANRLIRTAHDERYRGALKPHAEAERGRTLTVSAKGPMIGAYREVQWVKREAVGGRRGVSAANFIPVNFQEWAQGPARCAEDTLSATDSSAPSGRNSHTAVWTGSEMIVWGGYAGGFDSLDTGARYDPATDSWTATSLKDAPRARYRHTAVWTGSEMIVWGGADRGETLLTGATIRPRIPGLRPARRVPPKHAWDIRPYGRGVK